MSIMTTILEQIVSDIQAVISDTFGVRISQKIRRVTDGSTRDKTMKTIEGKIYWIYEDRFGVTNENAFTSAKKDFDFITSDEDEFMSELEKRGLMPDDDGTILKPEDIE